MGGWEIQRWQFLQLDKRRREHYCLSGAEGRFPYYGKDTDYEVDYFIEIGLEPKAICYARFHFTALHVPQAAALLAWRWSTSSPYDEEAAVELRLGQKVCRHAARPGAWWMPWWPGSHSSEVVTPYSDWLAWAAIDEVKVVPPMPA